MSTCMYDASVPVLRQMLGSLDAILEKAEQHAAEKHIEPAALIQSRLFPDMFTFSRQVAIACHFARSIATELAGADVPQAKHSGDTFPDLRALVAEAARAVATLTPAQFEDSEKREVTVHAGTPHEGHFGGEKYLLHYAMPQFFFHVTTAYALLRHAGVEIGKRDFLGKF